MPEINIFKEYTLINKLKGKVVKGLGGLYDVDVFDGKGRSRMACRAKGILKRDEEKVLVGDAVTVSIDEDTPDGIVISEISPRRNSLIRPPLANLDYLFIVFASKKPMPVTETVDKLIAIAEHNNIEPIVVITKSDLDSSYAEQLYKIYSTAGFDTFITSTASGEGVDSLFVYLRDKLKGGRIGAFAGASGVGKSTLINSLFPSLSLATSEISKKIERGKHTTRHVELYAIDEGVDCGYLADTPGFSLIDFSRFDFFTLEELSYTFRELREYRGKCRYQDCNHVGEGSEDCAVARASELGLIAPSRLESYRSIYRVLKNKNNYE